MEQNLNSDASGQEQLQTELQNDAAQELSQEQEQNTPPQNQEEKTDVNFSDTGLNNLKNIAQKKGLDFDEFQQSYVANNCQLSPEMKQKCLDAGIPEEFISRAVEGIKVRHEQEMSQVAQIVGGRENLTKTLEWGRNNLTKEELQDIQYDLSSNPSLTTAQAIIFYIHNKMNTNEGKAPDYVSATSGASSITDIFKSKAEALKAMSDPRYDATSKEYDEAYAKEVEAKIERTKQANNGISLFG